MAPLAAYIRSAAQYYECPWQVFRLGHFKGLSDEDAARALGAWARREKIVIHFDLRRVDGNEMVVVHLGDGRQ